MATTAAVAIAVVVIAIIILAAVGYDINRECKPSEECEKCPFPRCENKQEKESEVKQ